MEVFNIDQRSQWENTLRNARRSDFYHTHAYHALAQRRGEGIAHMWVYREAGYMIALPLLVRPLESVQGLERTGCGWYDAVSVYGYAGPVASHEEIPEAVIENFHAALLQSLQERRIISVFSRLHPLIHNERMVEGLGDCIYCGDTVAIDLTLTPQEQWKKFRTNHQRQIKKLKRFGYNFVQDDERKFLPEFVSIYTETMKRVEAKQEYFFEHAYFESLFEGRERNANLFVLTYGGTPVCGGIFIESDGIVEFHLGGTRNSDLQYAPMKLLINEVRLWATAKCFKSLHLGGGKSSLFHFKVGFAEHSYPFSTWQWVVDFEIYELACERRMAFDECHGMHAVSGGFFPRYRSLAEPDAVSRVR